MNLRQIKTWPRSNADVMMDMIRIYLGVALFFKGIFFMANRDYLLQIMDQAGTWSIAPAVLAHYIIPVHLVGGVLLALGLVTRFAAIAQIPILLGAVLYVHMPQLRMMSEEPRQNFELSALVLFLTLLIAMHGSGRFSVDRLLSKQAPGDPHAVPRTA